MCVGVGVRVAQSETASQCTRNAPFTSTMKCFALVCTFTLEAEAEGLDHTVDLNMENS